ncbi:unnamed protein product [Nippostrongylus brasiliensis]|nr:unnamed protein product [Nippostrongylus brasiliensis]
MVYQMVVIALAVVMVTVMHRRLVPLKMTPVTGKAAKYKRGTFYRM